jgi:hypothetical protein
MFSHFFNGDMFFGLQKNFQDLVAILEIVNLFLFKKLFKLLFFLNMYLFHLHSLNRQMNNRARVIKQTGLQALVTIVKVSKKIDPMSWLAMGQGLTNRVTRVGIGNQASCPGIS